MMTLLKITLFISLKINYIKQVLIAMLKIAIHALFFCWNQSQMSILTWKKIHFEISRGGSPDAATLKIAPKSIFLSFHYSSLISGKLVRVEKSIKWPFLWGFLRGTWWYIQKVKYLKNWLQYDVTKSIFFGKN